MPKNGIPGANRMRSAGKRACNAWAECRSVAEQLSEELDDATAPHGIPVTDLDEADSMVVAVKTAVAVNDKR
jgi:hypothetical protein